MPTSTPFLCKKCQYKGVSRVDVVPELNDKAKKRRCMCLLIPLCWIMGCCMLCEGTPCREGISDRKHVCPQCETENARWIALSPAAEVTQQELADAMERMKIDAQYGRYF